MRTKEIQGSDRHFENGNLKAYLGDVVAGRHYRQDRCESEEDRFARVEALAMAASTVEICSRKKGKANRPSESKKILLGHYIRLSLGSQESRVYLGAKRLRRGKQINRNFGIKITFIPKLGGMCLHQNLERKAWKLEASKIVSIKDSFI